MVLEAPVKAEELQLHVQGEANPTQNEKHMLRMFRLGGVKQHGQKQAQIALGT